MDEQEIGVQEAALRKYYTMVDNNDFDAVAMCFAPDAVYNRPGYSEFRGRPSIWEFYTSERGILDGRHHIEDIMGRLDKVAVRGIFKGNVRGGAHVEVGFADFFEFDESGRFSRRDTYFYSPTI